MIHMSAHMRGAQKNPSLTRNRSATDAKGLQCGPIKRLAKCLANVSQEGSTMTTPNESVQDEWAELRAAAGLATPGPWCADVEEFTEDGHYEPPSVSGCVNDESYILCVMAVGHNETQNAKYIALASPDCILALLAQRDALAAELTEVKGDGWEDAKNAPEWDGSEDLSNGWLGWQRGEPVLLSKCSPLWSSQVRYYRPLPAPPQSATEEKK
jgi:hypothetical protein